ncbi:Mn-dependent transcriptional regulator MntR [Algibacter lectus]|uniref:Mn-dependent transcriptional regulator MntR n=1 Tax=Algibacter lectus TaxID=221126 RepID=A0A090X4W9_9FLAO|nr:Mn-dependent transcriptional regulator MntR [Algibacter lectus]
MCWGVKDSSSEFLKYLDKHGIALGTELKVTNKEPFDNSITITINHSEFIISNIIANNLFVKLA